MTKSTPSGGHFWKSMNFGRNDEIRSVFRHLGRQLRLFLRHFLSIRPKCELSLHRALNFVVRRYNCPNRAERLLLEALKLKIPLYFERFDHGFFRDLSSVNCGTWNKKLMSWNILKKNKTFVSSHVWISWTHLSKSAYYFGDAFRCVRSADQNMAAYNRPLDSAMNLWIQKRKNSIYKT